VVRDPELKKTQSGVSLVNFSIAVERPYKYGEDRQADFFDCVAWRATAEFFANNFRKGDMVGVSGRLQTHSWSADDGTKRKNVEVAADSISFVSNKQSTSAPAEKGKFPIIDANDGELPF
jgi:single-strand DNA-binding protein